MQGSASCFSGSIYRSNVWETAIRPAVLLGIPCNLSPPGGLCTLIRRGTIPVYKVRATCVQYGNSAIL
jgi:hypothetical protein